MELSGAEKKIRASFRELRLADALVMPPFAAVWSGAHLKSARQPTARNFRIAAAVVVVSIALFSLALISRHWQRNPRSNYALASGVVQPAASLAQIKKDQELVQQDGVQVVRKPGLVRLATRNQTVKLAARRSTTRDAIALLRWQSPTASLLRSPGDEVLKALPQLNQTLHDMKTFLPNRTN